MYFYTNIRNLSGILGWWDGVDWLTKGQRPSQYKEKFEQLIAEPKPKKTKKKKKKSKKKK